MGEMCWCSGRAQIRVLSRDVWPRVAAVPPPPWIGTGSLDSTSNSPHDVTLAELTRLLLAVRPTISETSPVGSHDRGRLPVRVGVVVVAAPGCCGRSWAGREPGARAVVDLHPGRAQLLDPAVALILVQSSSATHCTACSLRSMTSFRAAAILRYRSSGGAHRAAGRRWHAVKRRRTTRDSPAVRAGGRPRGTCRSGGSRLINLEP